MSADNQFARSTVERAKPDELATLAEAAHQLWRLYLQDKWMWIGPVDNEGPDTLARIGQTLGRIADRKE
jgi:hypothetical protein